MKSLTARPRRSPRSLRSSRTGRTTPVAPSPALTWIHDGLRYRATVWPDVRFEREVAPETWVVEEAGEDIFASTVLAVSSVKWRDYLEFVPADVRDLLVKFEYGRMATLQVITECPALLAELQATPALAAFLATHRSLRGGAGAGWGEMAAVFEREQIFGVLQWLGLPASRQTLTILRNIADPDIPRRLLEPLRAALWDPEAIWALAHAPALTDERLAQTCHALAA
jgi:hypothetical protein